MYDNKRSIMKKWKYGLIAAALTVSMIMALPIWTVGQAQAAPNLENGSCALTIERASEMPQGDIVVDLYKVADVEAFAGYDAYTLNMTDGYTEFESQLDEAMNQEKQQEEGANALYRALAQELSKKVLSVNGAGSEGEQNLPVPTKTIDLSADKSISGVDPGMYLIIAHGKDLSAAQYTTYVTEEESGEKKIATVAYSNEYVYTYLPELISLPMRGVGTDANTPTGSFGTDDDGEWLSNVTITLKSEESLALVGLMINKTFNVPEGIVVSPGEGCVYQIEATLNGETVYSNVVELKYEGKATGTVRLEKIVPAGAEVTVTEVYDGAAFTVSGDSTKTIIAELDSGDVINNQVFFVNTANGNGTGGDIVTNHFDNDDAGWTWNNPKPGVGQ